MAVVVLDLPARMVSLSSSAQNREVGIRHDIAAVLGPAEQPRWGIENYKVRYKIPVDGLVAHTVCGKQIDGYPEVRQTTRPCSPCSTSKKARPLQPLIRVLPPVDTAESVEGWSLCYWETYCPPQMSFMQVRDDGVQVRS